MAKLSNHRDVKPLEWHMEALRNSTIYEKQRFDQAIQFLMNWARAAIHNEEYQRAIERAKEKGLKELPISWDKK